MTISEKKMQIVIDNYFKSECDVNTSIRQAFEKGFRIGIKKLPSAQPDDWMERNKERILQAGMEGREIEFRIGGRLFAIREKAQ